jgi:hypothetical protein
MSNEYHFLTRWRLRATPEEVDAVLSDAQDLPRWRPSVFLDVQVVEARKFTRPPMGVACIGTW